MFGEERQKEDQVINEMNDKLALMRDWQKTFSTEHGRRVLIDLLDSTFMYNTVFTGNSRTYYNAAYQDYGKKILDTLATADPDTFLWVFKQRSNYLKKLMHEEFEHARKIDEARRDETS